MVRWWNGINTGKPTMTERFGINSTLVVRQCLEYLCYVGIKTVFIYSLCTELMCLFPYFNKRI
jgi:hypothetical protein